MQIPKPTDVEKDAFRALAGEYPVAVVKPMFGNLAAFVHDNMFMGLFGGDLGVKLNGADTAALVAEGGGPFGPAQRPMSGYTTLPRAWVDDRAAITPWVERALEHVSKFPPKVAKPKKSKPAPG